MENLHEKAVGKQSINKPIEDLIFSIFMLEISFSSGKIQNKVWTKCLYPNSNFLLRLGQVWFPDDAYIFLSFHAFKNFLRYVWLMQEFRRKDRQKELIYYVNLIRAF
jgi:hypothetical protein